MAGTGHALEVGLARRRNGPRGSRAWPYIAVGALVVLGAAAFYPRVNLVAGDSGLASVSSTSLMTGLGNLRVSWQGGSVPARAVNGQVIPLGAVPASTTVTVSGSVAAPSWLSWLPNYQSTGSWAVRTPAAPRPVRTVVTRALHGSTSIPFNAPVTRWRVETTSGFGPWHSGPVRLPSGGAAPGERGTIRIQAETRSWEQPSAAVAVRWQTPAYLTASEANATTIMPTGELMVRFSGPLVNARPGAWKLSPNVPGTWKTLGPGLFGFTPSGAGFPPGSTVTVTVPGGSHGVKSRGGSYLAKTFQGSTTVVGGSVTRLQQWLAALGYLPVTWQPSSTTAVAANTPAIWQPQPGTFGWRWTTLPSALTSLWQPGVMNVMTQGALMQFQRVAGLPVTGVANGSTWSALLQAWTNHQMSPDGYSYILVSETSPESLQLWVNGVKTLTTAANTGIALTPTELGTNPIYERLPFQVMRGTNPDGTPYADPVYWINYFYGGDAVHGFVRASYGFPQSLGCVEVPPSVASTIYQAVHYGTLVTVLPPGAPA